MDRSAEWQRSRWLRPCVAAYPRPVRPEGVHNVEWVWAPNAESAPGLFDVSSPNNWRHYYPGDSYVDWVGIDGYNWGDVPAPGGARWRASSVRSIATTRIANRS